MVSEKEVEAAREAWREYWSDVIGQYDDNKGPMEGMRRALEAAARVRAEDNAEPVAWRYKLFEGDPEWTVTTEKPQGAVVEPLFTCPSEQAVTDALADALRGLLQAYENAFDWSAELPPETAEAERIANEVLEALTSSKPEQAVPSGWKLVPEELNHEISLRRRALVERYTTYPIGADYADKAGVQMTGEGGYHQQLAAHEGHRAASVQMTGEGGYHQQGSFTFPCRAAAIRSLTPGSKDKEGRRE